MSTKCFGYDYRTGHAVRVEFGAAIEAVDELVGPVEGIETWLAPGFIDLQVNGFAGVDYCSPHSSLEEIGRSIRAQFACGVSRIYPTVITGSAEDMQGALRNLAKAKRELPEGEAFEAILALPSSWPLCLRVSQFSHTKPRRSRRRSSSPKAAHQF